MTPAEQRHRERLRADAERRAAEVAAAIEEQQSPTYQERVSYLERLRELGGMPAANGVVNDAT